MDLRTIETLLKLLDTVDGGQPAQSTAQQQVDPWEQAPQLDTLETGLGFGL